MTSADDRAPAAVAGVAPLAAAGAAPLGAPVAAPALALAEGFARHVADWSRTQGAAEPQARAAGLAARAASLALSDGHVCVLLGELAARAACAAPDASGSSDAAAPPGTRRAAAEMDVQAWRETLLASRVVGTADAPGALPLVVDAGDRLYLHRFFDYERRLAQRVLRAAQAGAPIANAGERAALRAQLAGLFAANAARLGGAADWQMIATALALRGRLAVVSGGPGTGKTTTVVNLLACLLALDPGCRIALAAPTGKAAARMSEAIRERAVHLPQAIRALLPAGASTIHRLLGASPRGFAHHAGRQLPIDALVVDEASMLDLALATRLLEAVPDGARIVLLGDKDQLAAVESGAVFAELCTDPALSAACRDDLAELCGIAPQRIAAPAPIEARAPDAAPALRDTTVWFTRNFRFGAESAIGRLAAAINAGRSDDALALLAAADGAAQHDAGAALRWLDDAAAQLAPAAIGCLASGYAPFFDAVARGAAQAGAVIEAFARFRALCAVREGPRGAGAVNDELTRRLRERIGVLDANPRSPWFPGRPVLVRRNDAVLGLFNGDVGIALPGADGALMVHFAQAGGASRAIAPLRLPEHETAFALTVHQAQGSEFDAVFVLLPARGSRVLTRELLYTAVTRARERVTLCAGAALLSAAIEARTQRRSGLAARLAEGVAHEHARA